MARKKPGKAIREAVAAKQRGRPPKPQPAIEFKEGLKNIEKLETVALGDIDLEDRTFQYRVKEKISDLIPSLISEGQLVPIILWGKKPPYKIVDGYRRTAAIQSLAWPSVRAIVRRNLDEEGAFRLSFIENVKRKNFSPIDMANALWKLQARGKTNDNLEAEFGLSARQIQRYRKLIEFPEAVKAALADERITMSHAQLLNVFSVKDPVAWIETIVAEKMSALALKRKLRVQAGIKGRSKHYLRKSDKGFRLVPIKLNQATPIVERNKIIHALTQALEIARRLAEPHAKA